MTSLNIAIIGYGKMGKEIETTALESGHTVKSIIDPKLEKKDNKYNKIDKESLKDVDVCIDFTIPKVALNNIKKIAEHKKNIIIGTTGWYNQLDEAKKIIEKNNIGLLYAPNFSIGVNLFFKIIKNASKAFNKFDNYDPFILELHHKQKLDSPSGTAKKLGEIIIKNIDRKTTAQYDKLDRKINPEELHITSVRVGSIPGTHNVGFDSQADTIELKHTARGRKGFAQGAVIAAKWINNKKGIFTIDDMMKSIIGGN
ncbi:4-hydroxy-tetrahydrodipicolinate reductase [archaeon]|nr:4-hydroxy-tetrahydrodipicolinate reductase [archaeon]